MNVVSARLPPDPDTCTPNSPSRSAPGNNWPMFSRTVPSGPVTGLARAVRTTVCAGSCGGLVQVSRTVTGVRGGKPRPWTTHACRALPRLWPTMHRPGTPLPPPRPDEPHTVSGGAGGPPGGRAVDPVVGDERVWLGALELLSAAPRMTPTTTRAAPTEAQPAQAMCSRSHRRQPEGPDAAPGGVRPCPGLRRGAGL